MALAREIMRPRDESEDPPSPFSYFFPLILVVLACGGYIFWRRMRSRRNLQSTLPLNFPSRTPTGIRLSEDGPPANSFIHNNASTDSLPSHALQEIPELSEHNSLRSSPIPYTDTTNIPLPRLPNPHKTRVPSTSARLGAGRRSAKAKIKSPVEEDEETSDEESGKATFDIGDEDDNSEGGDDIGPLGKS
ncbi:uncharacterized protein IL334_005670 [Kwoniella shivajii]|uniref:Uncharacterized protein n=1 Tax=Kwoniella shivajii TaxID=564305 RepID=A0ABZ1D5N1_9TREE|nr:hypothetical protein IL334_005670 [Kwoniella shivajii]